MGGIVADLVVEPGVERSRDAILPEQEVLRELDLAREQRTD
mgnify:CR=1 FL=1